MSNTREYTILIFYLKLICFVTQKHEQFNYLWRIIVNKAVFMELIKHSIDTFPAEMVEHLSLLKPLTTLRYGQVGGEDLRISAEVAIRRRSGRYGGGWP